jgi:hypothetical protein
VEKRAASAAKAAPVAEREASAICAITRINKDLKLPGSVTISFKAAVARDLLRSGRF